MKNGKVQKALGILAIFGVVATSVLLIIALFSRVRSGETIFGTYEMGTAFAISIIILLLLLLRFLLLLLFGMIEHNRYNNKNRPDVVLENAQAAPDESAEQPEQKDIEEEPKPEQPAEMPEAGEEVPEAGRFCKLIALDEAKAQYKRTDTVGSVSLKQFCDSFRAYAAGHLKLYYDISDIRRFIAGLAVSKILILQGMSGTGKTSLAHAFGDFLDNPATVIPVQPMWKERTDLIGYYNEFTKRFNETTLLEKMYEANYSDDIYVTVLDEMNIARVEYYFAEFLSLLELPNVEERLITVVSDMWESDPEQLQNGNLRLPPNMWFIGTANNDDSTFAISDKVYDRAMILDLDQKSDPFEVSSQISRIPLSAHRFEELVKQAMREYALTARNLHRLEDLDRYLMKHFHITFGNRIMKQIRCYIPVFVACGGDELDALDDILAKKVFRKLKLQNPIYLRNTSAALSAYLDELFGDNRMAVCKAFIANLERNI